MADILSEVDSINATANTPADGDSGQISSEPSNTASASSAAPNSVNTDANINDQSSATNTVNGQTYNPNDDLPGRRLHNPLGQFASYTYQISLYMVTPAAYLLFVNSGRQDINQPGIYLVAQNGGINNDGIVKRAPGFTFDYGIDNFKMTNAVSTKDSGTNVNVTEMSFQVTEPYGFSFIRNLKNAALQVASDANNAGQSVPDDPTKQFFIIGFRFFGYDAQGNILTGTEQFENGILDPNASTTGESGGLFTKYYDIVITELNFKIEGKAVVYDIKAAETTVMAGLTLKRGMINHDTSVTAGTVGDALSQIARILNDNQQKMLEANKIGKVNKYSFIYAPSPGQSLNGDGSTESDIANAKLVNAADQDKYKWPGSGATSTTDSNAATELKAPPKSNARVLTWNADTPIPQAVEDVVKSSSYLSDALKLLYTTNIESDPQKNTPDQINNSTKKPISWYNLQSMINNVAWDNVVQDWAFDLSYVLTPYATPITNSVYANPGQPYYGPVKRYKYWYTGKNSEILSYSQSFDSLYYQAVVDASANSNKESTDGGTNPNTNQTGSGNSGDSVQGGSKTPDKRTGQSTLGKTGPGFEAQNNYLNSLYDSHSISEATIDILGDPDFLVSVNNDTINGVYSQFYGQDGYTISANGGQVFVEIDFKEGLDYSWEDSTEQNSNNTVTKLAGGVQSINDSIMFWPYPPDIAKIIQGISYQVVTIDSTFSNGAFKQRLQLTLNTFPNATTPSKDTGRENPTTPETPSQGQGASGPNPGAGGSTTSSTGLLQDNPANQAQPATQLQNDIQSGGQPTAPTGTTTSSSPNPNVISAANGLLTGGGLQLRSPSSIVADDDGGVIPPRLGPGGP